MLRVEWYPTKSTCWILTPRPSGCDCIWKRGLYGGNQVNAMRSCLTGVLMKRESMDTEAQIEGRWYKRRERWWPSTSQGGRLGTDPSLPDSWHSYGVCAWKNMGTGEERGEMGCVWVWFQGGGREEGRGRLSGDGTMWGAVVRVKTSFPGDGLGCRGKAS